MRSRCRTCWLRAGASYAASGPGLGPCFAAGTFGTCALAGHHRPFSCRRSLAGHNSDGTSRAVSRRAAIAGGLLLSSRAFGFGRERCTVACGRGRSRRRRLLAASKASESPGAPLRRLLQEGAALLESEALRVAILGNLRVLLLIGDVGTVTAIQHLDAIVREIEDQSVGVRLLLEANDFERPLEGNGVVVIFLERHVLAAVFHVRPELAYVGNDLLTLRGFPQGARKSE